MKKLLAILLLAASAGAYANSACDKPKNDFDDIYCLNKVYSQADKELNKSYGELAKLLDANGKKMLKASQMAWISNRNDSCSYKDHRGFFVNLSCATQATIERLQFLNDRKRECNSAGCMNSKLQ